MYVSVRGHYYTEQCLPIIVTLSHVSCVSCIKGMVVLCFLVLPTFLYRGIGNHYSVLCIIIYVTIVPH